ncbi:MAG TPA: O-antigen polysaccharide polymerase Wzy [Blastocatellia bacterium]|nr:O-antigen polysaccharide polymerase Wzy [Blastocatellia bacterium]
MLENYSIDYSVVLLFDFLIVSICATILLRYGRLSHSHPGTIYLFFHIYTFSLRLIGLTFGSLTMLSQYMLFFEPIREDEIVRAAILGDVALIVMTIAWLKASRDDLKKVHKHSRPLAESKPDLSLKHIWSVVVIAFPLGLFGLWAFTNLPGVEGEGVELGEWQTSNWFFITQVWAGLSLLALIYWYGFKWWLMMPMSLYLLVMAFQGYHRFRVIIPAILLIQIYLDRHKLKWPPVYVLAIIVFLMLLFFPLKEIGRLAQEGEDITQIVDVSRESVNTAIAGHAPDHVFLDQFACALTLTDAAGKYYYGRTYLALVTLPIPRQWWPNKPGLADFLIDISVPTRPMSEMGMIVTFLGESYVNFGHLGLIFVPGLLAYFLGRTYFRAYRSNYFSVVRLTYLLIACNLIQVYRDGLTSIVVFTWVNMMPLMVIVALHYILPLKQQRNKLAMPAQAGYEKSVTP